MSFVNSALRALFDVLLAPFQGMHYLVSLTLVSVAFGILALLVYKYLSDQAGIDAAKRKIFAGIFEIRLFNDDLGAILRAMGQVLRHNLTYLRHAGIPLLVMMPPLVLMILQLEPHYTYAALAPGQRTVLALELGEGWEQLAGLTADGIKPRVEIDVPEGLALDSPSVWSPTTRELAWRLTAEKPGEYEIRFRVGDETVSKSVRVGGRVVRRSPVRVAPTILAQLRYPAEAPLDAPSAVTQIRVGYPDNGMLWDVPTWIWQFLVISLIAGFALKGVFGVTL